MNHNVVMNDKFVSGTSLMGYFPEPTKYSDLVKVFGEPNCEGDNYKVDAEWVGLINEKPFTIYNYKTGKNYNGPSGTATTKITSWHIGGNEQVVANMIVEYFKDKLKPKKKIKKWVIWVAHEYDTLTEADHAERDFQKDGHKTKLGVI